MIKVNRKTLNLAIPIEIETDDGVESAILHAAPLDANLFNEFSSDLASVIAQIFENNPLVTACEYLAIVEGHIRDTRQPEDAERRIARLNKIILSEVSMKGMVVSSFSDFQPVPVTEAIDAGLLTLDDLELAMSKYLFFSRALRVSRSLVAQFAGTYQSAIEYGLGMALQQQSEASNSSSPAQSESETLAEKVTQSSIEPSTVSQDLPQASSPEKTQRRVRAIGQSSGN